MTRLIHGAFNSFLSFCVTNDDGRYFMVGKSKQRSDDRTEVAFDRESGKGEHMRAMSNDSLFQIIKAERAALQFHLEAKGVACRV